MLTISHGNLTMIQESTTMKTKWCYQAGYLPMSSPPLTSINKCTMNNKGSQVKCDAFKRNFHLTKWKDTSCTKDDQSYLPKTTCKGKSYSSIMIM